MSAVPAGPLAPLLREHRLLDPAQQAEVDQTLAAQFPTDDALLNELARRGWLTAYQRDQIKAGHGAALRLGPFVITGWLGAGGMGEVYQARQDKLGRVVALKVIRRERLEKPDAVRRFHREIRAAARLDHPNIVRAYDADEIGGTHLLVMEFVPGTDLARLVRDRGPLPAAVAGEYVRQAALGLQHAAEKGLVHRDLKPANLLLTPAGVVKILDMGLARLRAEGDADASSTVTREGVVMGSPDFIAPEQAMNPRTIDVRADLYSLGCTFYFLLTGQPPFAGGETVQKLMRHQLEEPVPVEALGTDVTPRAAAVVRRLMAKRPEDRFQAPADVAAALAADGPDPASFPTGYDPAVPRPFPQVDWDEVVTPDDDRTTELTPPRRPRRLGWLLAAAAAAVLLAAVGLLLKYGRSPAPPPDPPHTPPVAKAETPPAPATFDDWVKRTRALSGARQIDAVYEELKRKNKGRAVPLSGPGYEGGTLVEIHVLIDHARDLSPLQGFGGLRRLTMNVEQKSEFGGLDGLKGLKLTFLRCEGVQVKSLAPLKEMPLESLFVSYNPELKDLTPLAGMTTLKDLRIVQTAVTDLAPLKDLSLHQLHCHGNDISDLTPVRHMTDMTVLDAGGGRLRVKDLEAVRGMTKLTLFSCDGAPVADLGPLKGKPLVTLSISGTAAADLTPIEGAPLESLNVANTRVPDLEAVGKIKTLTELTCSGTPITDLGPVARLPKLVTLTCADCKGVTDLGPLAKTRLTYVVISGTGVTDLTPLRTVPLDVLDCARTAIQDFTPLGETPIRDLKCSLWPDRDPGSDVKVRAMLGKIKTLQFINHQPAKDILSKKK